MTQSKPTADQKRRALRRSDQMSLLDDDIHQPPNHKPPKPSKARLKKKSPKTPPAQEPNYDPDTLDLFLDPTFRNTDPPSDGDEIQPLPSNPQNLDPEPNNHNQASPVSNLETAAIDLQALLKELSDIQQMLEAGEPNHEDRDL